jgi:N-acetylmuramoyl-L-alanine amidase
MDKEQDNEKKQEKKTSGVVRLLPYCAILVLALAMALALVPQTRQGIAELLGFGDADSENSLEQEGDKADHVVDVSAKTDAGAAQEGRNQVDYSVVSGTVTTVDSATPGQSFIADKATFDTYRGFLLTVELPEGISPEMLDYQDDYMKRQLTVRFPLSYYEAFSKMPVKGLYNSVKKVKYKKAVDCAKLKITFSKTFAFHYCVDDGVLYIKYGSPSYYYDRIVVIDAGHGGVDYGAYTWDQTYIEKKICMQVADKLIRDFSKQDDVMVYYTRTDDTGVALADRIGLANDIGADLFLSLHCNYLEWGTAYGVETCYNPNDKHKKFNSEWFATKFQEAYPDAMGLYSRGLLAYGDLRVLRLAEMPACLLEMGFLSDSGDAAVLSNSNKQQVAADTIEQVIYESLEEIKSEESKNE